jgi:hypothetical protein
MSFLLTIALAVLALSLLNIGQINGLLRVGFLIDTAD